MINSVIIDTNLFLDDSNIIFKLSRNHDLIVIPVTVLVELDEHKFKPDTSFSAREAIRAILDFKQQYPDKIKFTVNDDEISKADLKIIRAALESGAKLATKDISMSIIAEAKGVNCQLYDIVLNNLFKPYAFIEMEDLYECMGEDTFAYAKEYKGEEYEEVVECFSEIAKQKLIRDSWFFVFINHGAKEPAIYANNPLKHTLNLINNDARYRVIETEGSIIKARDHFQVCAIYALREAPHTLITGTWGSGKTLLGTAYTLSHSRKKAFITRPSTGISSKFNLGFEPGDKFDKMVEWCGGFLSALYFLYGSTRDQSGEGGIGYDFVRDELFKSKFELLPINKIQGMSLLNDDIMIVDEVQLIDVNYMSMILSRPSETGKLILLGDLKQTYNVVKPSESGLLKLLRALPHRSIAMVELQNSYRSELLEVADLLQDKTLI
jgi:PhoH-like ATPase